MTGPIAAELAVKAAYKKGLIDAAQAVCLFCRGFSLKVDTARPSYGASTGWTHGQIYSCGAPEIMDLLEKSGGWQAQWPLPHP